MNIQIILPQVVHVDFPNIVSMAKALGRAQEYAENPRLSGTVFSWSRLKKYTRGSGAKRCYCKSALGFNFPSLALLPFFDGAFELTKYEKEVLDQLEALGLQHPYYVIASADGSATKERFEALDHELCHALWATNPDYKKEVLAALEGYPDLEMITTKVRNWGIYAEHVIQDEVHAYLATDSLAILTGKRFKIKLTRELEEIHSQLSDILQRYKA